MGNSRARLSNRDGNRENGGNSSLVILLQAIGKRFSPWPAAEFPHELFADARAPEAGTSTSDSTWDAERFAAGTADRVRAVAPVEFSESQAADVAGRAGPYSGGAAARGGGPAALGGGGG